MAGRIPSPEWKKEFNRKSPQYQVWYPGDTVNMAIGQGFIGVTPMQMACFIASLARGSALFPGEIRGVSLLGSKEAVTWSRDAGGLKVRMPGRKPCDYAYALKIIS